MFLLAQKVREYYWDRGKRSLRINLLLGVCNDLLRTKRANHFKIVEVESYNLVNHRTYVEFQQPSHIEAKKQFDEEQKPITTAEQDVLNKFEVLVINALSHGAMLELHDFQKFLKTGKL